MDLRHCFFFVCVFACAFLLAGCPGDDDDDDIASPVDDDVADDDADDDVDDDVDDDAAECEPGDGFCDEAARPWTCVDGAWVEHAPCGQWTYCNFGECVELFIDWPADESPHRDLIEWWYWTGHLMDVDGNLYGFELTFFYGAAMIRLPAWMINVAVLDEKTGEHTEAVWLDFGWADETPNVLSLGSMDASVYRGEDDVFHLVASTDAHIIDLTLTDTQGPAYHGGNGLIRMSSRTADSFYYSRPRMDALGTVDRGDGPIAVEGEAWMDHQWGNFNPFVLYGWDWFSLQLTDGAELMFFVFRGDEHDPEVVDMASGTYVTPEGEQIGLRKEDVDVEALGEWASPTTGAVYPQDWRLRVPFLDLDVSLYSEMEDAEMVNPMWNYWEGQVEIDGENDSEPVGGRGFVELSGYAGRPALWWLFPDSWE